MAHRRIALALACLIALSATPALASTAHGGFGHAVVAKAKKCKKKHRRAAASRRCRRKAKPAVPPGLPSVFRAEISWSGTAVIDLHAWAGGLHLGWNNVVGAYDLEPPRMALLLGASRQRLVDGNLPSTRGLTFGVCYFDYPPRNTGPVDVDVELVYADGSVDHRVLAGLQPGDSFVDPLQQGGEPDPPGTYCPP
jgi:hypothetical protein